MANPQNYGAFVPTSDVWDVSEIYEATQDPKLQELLVRLYQNLNRLSLTTNIKDSAYYVQSEFVNGQSFFAPTTTSSATAQSPAMRQVFRLVVNFGALPNTGIKRITTTIQPNPTWSFTRIYATSTNPTALEYIPIPYASSAGDIELFADVNATFLRVNIITPSDYSAYTITYVILEYLKT